VTVGVDDDPVIRVILNLNFETGRRTSRRFVGRREPAAKDSRDEEYWRDETPD
jgi:hypothetical protein